MKAATQIFSLEVPPRKNRTRRSKPKLLLKRLRSSVSAVLSWIRARQIARPPRRLQLSDTVSLGEKRFAAVLEYEGERFLIGGAAQSVQLLTKLRSTRFSKTLASKQALSQETR